MVTKISRFITVEKDGVVMNLDQSDVEEILRQYGIVFRATLSPPIKEEEPEQIGEEASPETTALPSKQEEPFVIPNEQVKETVEAEVLRTQQKPSPPKVVISGKKLIREGESGMKKKGSIHDQVHMSEEKEQAIIDHLNKKLNDIPQTLSTLLEGIAYVPNYLPYIRTLVEKMPHVQQATSGKRILYYRRIETTGKHNNPSNNPGTIITAQKAEMTDETNSKPTRKGLDHAGVHNPHHAGPMNDEEIEKEEPHKGKKKIPA